MKKVISLLGMFLLFTSLNAQSPVGKWKLVFGFTETKSGKRVDLLKEEFQKQPCLANVIYIFSTDGKINTNADQCPDSIRKDLGVANLGIKWQTPVNNRINITASDEDFEPLQYVLIVGVAQGAARRAMTWYMEFGTKPSADDPEPVWRLTFTFHEL